MYPVKFIILLLVFISLPADSFTQTSVFVGFKSENSKTTETFQTTGKKLHIIHLRIKGKLKHTYSFKIDADPYSTISKDEYEIVKDYIKITSAKDGDLIDIPVLIKNDTIKELDEVLMLKISPDGKLADSIRVTNNTHTITIQNAIKPKKKNSILDPELRIDIGTNFDFINTVDATGLYANLLTFRPHMFRLKPKTDTDKFKRMGIIGGIYQSRSVSDTVEISRSEQVVTPITSIPISNDTITYLRQNFSARSFGRIDNLGLYLTVTGRINDPKDESFGAYLGLNMEVLRTERKNQHSLTPVSVDTIRSVRRISTRRLSEESETINHDAYFGVKIPLIYGIGKDVKVTIIPSAGFGVTNNMINSDFYYAFNFNVIDIGSGLNLGGDLRGFFPSYAPMINIYLSKAFDIKQLGKYKK